MKKIILITKITMFLLIIFVLISPIQAAVESEQKPNIVLVLMDNFGYGEIGVYGGGVLRGAPTPNIDSIAAEGFQLTNYNVEAECTPSRSALMTGRYGIRTRQRQDGPPRGVWYGITKWEITLAEMLTDQGYTTGIFGKWHLGPDKQGFDISSSDGLKEDSPKSKGKSMYGNVDVAENLTNRSLKFIEDNRNKPFFLYLAHWDVHVPLNARKNVVKKYEDKLAAMSAAELKELKDRIPSYEPSTMAVYAAMAEALDTSVKRVVAKVKELGLEKNTLIIFSSDNGGTSFSQLAPLRGTKGSLFEAGVRVDV